LDLLDVLAGKPPNEASRDVEKLAGRPTHFGHFVTPGVEKQATVIEGEPPFRFRNAHGFLTVETRPRVEIGKRNAISGEARAFLDGVNIRLFLSGKTYRADFRRSLCPLILSRRNWRNWRNVPLSRRNLESKSYAFATRKRGDFAACDAS
jgi:hypothetical protein